MRPSGEIPLSVCRRTRPSRPAARRGLARSSYPGTPSVTWATLVRGDTLRERVCADKLVGSAQEFTDAELEDPILRGIEKDDSVARNPCLRRGPLSLDYWTRLPIQFWRALRVT
jgi:hypothetical protein